MRVLDFMGAVRAAREFLPVFHCRIRFILEHLAPSAIVAFGIVLLLGVVPGPAGQTKLRIWTGLFAVLYGSGRLVMIWRRMRRNQKQDNKEDRET